MPRFDVTVTADAAGPIIEGRGPEVLHEFMDRATLRLAETAADWIRTDANAMDRSGRGGTGRAAAGVTLKSRTSNLVLGAGTQERVVWGEMISGQVWWPWLEGKSKRNRSTRFKGYHTFRDAKKKLDANMQEIIRPIVDDMVRKLGGA
jgi:hypothetical protein